MRWSIWKWPHQTKRGPGHVQERYSSFKSSFLDGRIPLQNQHFAMPKSSEGTPWDTIPINYADDGHRWSTLCYIWIQCLWTMVHTCPYYGQISSLHYGPYCGYSICVLVHWNWHFQSRLKVDLPAVPGTRLGSQEAETHLTTEEGESRQTAHV